MKAVQIIERGKPVFVDIPKPLLKSGYALIRTQRISLCGSDVQWIHHLDDSAYPSEPGVTGHEVVGVIEALAEDHDSLSVGDPVLALAPQHNAMAEYYLAPIDYLLKLPAGIAPELLVQAQQLGTVIYACKHLGDVTGKTVVVIGQGSAGLWFDFMLRKMGAKNIIGIDLELERLDVARFYGANHTILNKDVDLADMIKSINQGELGDLVIEAAGETETIRLSVDVVKDYGQILFFGVPRAQMVEFPMYQFFMKCCEALAVVHATRELRHASTYEAIEMIANGEIDVEPIITHRLPFTSVLDAYRMHHRREDQAIKIVIDMET